MYVGVGVGVKYPNARTTFQNGTSLTQNTLFCRIDRNSWKIITHVLGKHDLGSVGQLKIGEHQAKCEAFVNKCERQIFHSTLPVKVEFFDKVIKTRIKISINIMNIKFRGSIFFSQGHIIQVSQTWRQRQEAVTTLSSDKNEVKHNWEYKEKNIFGKSKTILRLEISIKIDEREF